MTNKINILFCGDFVSVNPARILFSEELESLLSESDVNCVNFEAPVMCNAKPIPKSGPSLYQSPDSPDFLIHKGFNVISIANNHIFDYGNKGFEASLKSFEGSNTIGAGDWQQAYSVKVLKINNISIGFLACSQNEFMTLSNNEYNYRKLGVAWVNQPLIDEKIQNTKKNVDYLFVLPHAGIENIEMPLPEWRLRYKQLIDCGADAVIASHPHIVQGYEIYKNAPIYYSLGNFFFERNIIMPEHWNHGLIVQCTIDDGKIEFKAHHTIRSNYDLSIDNCMETEKHFQYLCDLIQNTTLYNKQLKRTIEELAPEYIGYIESGLNLISQGANIKLNLYRLYHALKGVRDCNLILNMVRCESHRWVLERILETYYNRHYNDEEND